MGVIVLDGAEIGDGCIVGAGSLVPPGMKVPANTIVMVIPAKPIRQVRDSDLSAINNSLEQYMWLAKDYGDRNSR